MSKYAKFITEEISAFQYKLLIHNGDGDYVDTNWVFQDINNSADLTITQLLDRLNKAE